MRRSIFTALLVGALTQRALAQPAPASTTGAAPTPDDLSKAADVTAEVAGLADAGAAPSGAKASSDDIDLTALGLDPSAAAFDDKLNIYGFADVGWSWEHWQNTVSFIKQDTLSFAIGNLNIYLAKNLTARARALAEIRFSFMPNASTATADGSTVDTTASDVTNFGRTAQWGSILIERAYVEYDLTEHLTIRAGHFLTPYGIWNIDHGSPVILATVRPYIIGEGLFPEHQTGLDLFGSHYLGAFKLNYHATASNGRGAAEAQQDQDNNLGLGGRLELETPWGLKAGGSFYRGRVTGFAAAMGAVKPTYNEVSYAGDAQFDRGPLHLQAEIIGHDRHYENGVRTALATGFAPDSRDFGEYVLVGYRTEHLWNVMPFTYFEHYRPADHRYFNGIDSLSVGLNFRPTASLVLKLEASRTTFAAGPELLAGQTFFYFSPQAAWVF